MALSRHIFQGPTFYYKTGIVFVAYLNGLQDPFRMVGGLESGSSVPACSEMGTWRPTACGTVLRLAGIP